MVLIIDIKRHLLKKSIIAGFEAVDRRIKLFLEFKEFIKWYKRWKKVKKEKTFI